MATSEAFKQLFTKARRILKHPGLDFLVANAAANEKQRLVVITPGRIGNAVKRNTVRRRIKALFHNEKLDQKGIDAVVIVKKAGVNLSYDQLKELILQALSKQQL